MNISIDEKPSKLSLSPIAFSKGLIAKLSELKSAGLGFHTPNEKAGVQAVYDLFNERVNSIKGNEAKSPRYRELLRVRNTLSPGVLQEFGAFRHAVFQAMGELRAEEEKPAGPLTNKTTGAVLKHYSKDDLNLIEACAKAYSVVVKKKA